MTDKTTSPPPAYFLSLSLENVRSFGNKQEVSFLNKKGEIAQWTIVLGDNGVGKTTILKSLVASSPVQDNNEVSFYISRYLVNWIYNWKPIRHRGQEAAIISYAAGVGSFLKNINNRKEYKFKWEQKLTVQNQFDDLIKPKRSGTVLLDEVSSLVCYAYGAGRTVGESSLGEISSEDDSISLFNDRANLLNPEEWFLQADYRIKSDDHSLTKQNFVLLRKALIDVLDEVTDLKVSPVAPGGNPEQGLQFLTPYGWVRLRDMSLGYQTLVVWLTDFASKLFIRYPESANPLEEPAIVLIDEIDLHLHPEWQRKLIGFLSGIFKNTQFIATAHSPLVVQAAGDEGANVVLLKRVGDQTIVQQNPEDVRGWRVDQILTSTFFNLETARSLKTEKKMTRQATLLNKAKLTAKERQELDSLTLELEGQPMGSADGEAEEAEILRQLTARLEQAPAKKRRA